MTFNDLDGTGDEAIVESLLARHWLTPTVTGPGITEIRDWTSRHNQRRPYTLGGHLTWRVEGNGCLLDWWPEGADEGLVPLDELPELKPLGPGGDRHNQWAHLSGSRFRLREQADSTWQVRGEAEAELPDSEGVDHAAGTPA